MIGSDAVVLCNQQVRNAAGPFRVVVPDKVHPLFRRFGGTVCHLYGTVTRLEGVQVAPDRLFKAVFTLGGIALELFELQF